MSDTNQTAFGDFGKWVPGFEFLKSLSQPGAAAGALPQMPQMPHLRNWVAPTLNVEELDKRIQELRTVLFWLEQNGTALKATIQALEVQKMTLATLQGMNVSLQEMAQAFSIPTPGAAGAKPAFGEAGSAGGSGGFAGLEVPPIKSSKEAAKPRKAAKPEREEPAGQAAPAPGLVDPMQWWGALTQQFQTIADAAMKDVKSRGPDLSAGGAGAGSLAEQAGKTMTATVGQAGEMISQALKTSTEAWTDAVKKTTRGSTKAPAKSAGKKAASKSNAAPARKTAARKPATAAKAPAVNRAR